MKHAITVAKKTHGEVSGVVFDLDQARNKVRWGRRHAYGCDDQQNCRICPAAAKNTRCVIEEAQGPERGAVELRGGRETIASWDATAAGGFYSLTVVVDDDEMDQFGAARNKGSLK